MTTLLNITITLVTLIKVDHLSTPLLQNTSVLLSPGQPICSIGLSEIGAEGQKVQKSKLLTMQENKPTLKFNFTIEKR